jgi:hypothetical protein
MSKVLSVSSLDKNWRSKSYDLFVAAAGYEARSRYVAEILIPTALENLALGFECQQTLEFESNVEWYSSHGFTVEIGDDEPCAAFFVERLTSLGKAQNLSVLIDISSLSRTRIALFLEALGLLLPTVAVEVDFVYALAMYTDPVENESSNSHVGPVLPSFAGWWIEPDRAISAIVGVGYEQDKALGAVEHLQAADVWVFIPSSEIASYSPALAKANHSLLESVPRDRQLFYRVHDPMDCFQTIESLVYGLSLSENPVLLPFGPKLFALCCLLVALVHPQVPVWRVSAQDEETPVNRQASGAVYGLTVVFNAATTS